MHAVTAYLKFDAEYVVILRHSSVLSSAPKKLQLSDFQFTSVHLHMIIFSPYSVLYDNQLTLH
jgi:hypothetical protein